jgi:CelD/BcsL family acetyltransferase involved in cellulose biosynthesis
MVSVVAKANTVSLRLEVLEQFPSGKGAMKQWNSIAGDHPFLCYEWMSSWWASYGGGKKDLRLLVAKQSNHSADAEDWVSLLPLYVETELALGKVLRFLSNGRACGDHMAPAIKPGFEQASFSLFSNWLVQAANQQRCFDLIEWDGVDSANPHVGRLLEALVSREMQITTTDIEGSWTAMLDKDWPSFEKRLKKCFRRKTRKASQNRELPNVDVQIVTSASQIEESWPIFVHLHQARRHSLGQEGCFHDSDFEQFLFLAIHKLAALGKVAMAIATHDDTPFGCNLVLIHGDQGYLYQTGQDPQFNHLEPGHLPVSAIIQHAISIGLKHLAFLRGDEPYKARWNTERQRMVRHRVIPRRWSAIQRDRVWQAGRTVKSLIRSMMKNESNEKRLQA